MSQRLSRKGHPLLLVMLLAIALVLAALPYRKALFPVNKSLKQVALELDGHYQIFRPDGAGPFPAVLVYHGCGGPSAGLAEPRGDWLRKQGYVAIMVDSFTGRLLTERDVCNGYALWGSERAADVLASLDYARQLPYVDASRLALLGYSHGGWAVLDVLAHGAESKAEGDELKPSLAGVRAVSTFYPYCEFPARFRYQWKVAMPVLSLLAGEDSMVNTRACVEVLGKWRQQGLPIDVEVYSGVDHGFDGPTSMNTWNREVANKALQSLAGFLARHLKELHPPASEEKRAASL
ncbi:MAG: dienelactone hydrolase family protein [Endozoicomonas sp.]